MKNRQSLEKLLRKIHKWRKSGYKPDGAAQIMLSTSKSKKILFVFSVTLLLLFSGLGGGMLVYTEVYDDIQSVIVTTLCLSCIKLDPITRLEYTFETANNQPHPNFVLENLTTGPVFLAYREDVCEGCDIMEPLVQEIFNIHFDPFSTLYYEVADYSGSTVNFVHINVGKASGEIRESFFIYDQDDRGGVPMFVMVALGDNEGVIEPVIIPCYTTAYATLGLQGDEARKAFLRRMVSYGIEKYNEYYEEYLASLEN